jgi:glucose dehydrogenase
LFLVQGSLQFPGTAGGANWSGAALDPHAGYLLARGIKTMALRVKAQEKPAPTDIPRASSMPTATGVY